MVSRAELRYGGEWLDLFVAVLVTVLILGVLSLVSSGLVCLWAIVGLVIVMIVSLVHNSSTKKRARLITKESFPELEEACSTASKRLGMGSNIPVYVDGSSEINAYASGIVSPIIVLHRGLVNRMDNEELLYIIGHEMGHVKLRHTSLKTIFESGMHHVPLLVYLPMLAFRMIFLRGRMSRSMEHSADRAGLYACQSIEAAVRAQLKLERSKVTNEEVQAAIDSHGGSSDTKLGDLLRTHPKHAKRIREMVEYSRKTGVGWGQ